MALEIKNFNVIESTSTKLIVELSKKYRLVGQRHSDRRSGSSCWVTRIEQFGKWRVHNNPFNREDYIVVEKWGVIKASIFNGIKIAKTWSYKKDIIETLNNINK